MRLKCSCDNPKRPQRKKGPWRAAVVLNGAPIYIGRSCPMLTSLDSISTGMGESQNTKSKTLVSGTWIFCSHRWAASSRWFQIALSYLLILHLTPSFSIAGLSTVALGMTHWSSLFKHVMNHSRSRATADLVSRGSRLWWDQPVNAPLKLHHFVPWHTRTLLFFHIAAWFQQAWIGYFFFCQHLSASALKFHQNRQHLEWWVTNRIVGSIFASIPVVPLAFSSLGSTGGSTNFWSGHSVHECVLDWSFPGFEANLSANFTRKA